MIVVAGGSGLLGRLLVADLVGRGETVRVLVRDEARARALFAEDIEVVGADVRMRDGLHGAVRGAQVVVSAVHGFLGGRGTGPADVDARGNANLIEAAASVGADVVLVSVCGASPAHPVDLFRAKYAAEQYLRGSGAAWTIVRSPAYLETWLTLMAQTAGSSGRPMVFGRGEERIPFISAVDVAAVVCRAAVDPSLRGRTIELAGQSMTMNDLARALQDARGWSGAPRHVPRGMLRVLSVLAGPVRPAFARQNRTALAMDSGGMSVDVAEGFAMPLPTQSVSDVLAASISS